LNIDGEKLILFHNDDIIREFETKAVCQTNEDCEKCPIEKESEKARIAENFSYKKRLQKLLIDDWSQSKLPQPKKIDLEPSSKTDFEILECESNPELNPYIKKPKFSRDTANYDVSREGYTPKDLVCPETSTLKLHNMAVYELEDCEKPVDPKSVLTIIVDDEKMKKIFLDRSFYDVKIKSEIEDVKTEYIFLAENQFDFISFEANLERMIREAEFQNADIVAGAWVDENGHWSTSCLQFDVKPYQLDIKDGYYKSIRSAMYCDGSLGPLLIRTSVFLKDETLIKEEFSKIDFFLRNRTLRTISIPDCMFFVKEKILGRVDFLKIAQRFSLNIIRFDDMEYEFTCNEIGFDCVLSKFQDGHVAMPICCAKTLGALSMAVIDVYETSGYPVCTVAGNTLNTVKMPKLIFPWERDQDILTDSSVLVDHLAEVETMMQNEYNLKGSGPSVIDEGSYSHNMYHKETNMKCDNYGQPRSHQYFHDCFIHEETHKNATRVKFLDRWIRTQMNPGRASRIYGIEYLKHVSHSGDTKHYLSANNGWPECTGKPTHACLNQFPADGNIIYNY